MTNVTNDALATTSLIGSCQRRYVLTSSLRPGKCNVTEEGEDMCQNQWFRRPLTRRSSEWSSPWPPLGSRSATKVATPSSASTGGRKCYSKWPPRCGAPKCAGRSAANLKSLSMRQVTNDSAMYSIAGEVIIAGLHWLKLLLWKSKAIGNGLKALRGGDQGPHTLLKNQLSHL